MSQYRTGTVTVSGEYAGVVGQGTAFLANVAVGDLFKRQGQNVLYEIATVSSDTALTLASAYAGSGEVGVPYSITRDFTPNLELPEVWAGDKDWPYTLTRALRMIDTAFEGQVVDPTVTLTAAENLTSGNVVYVTSQTKVAKACADSVAKMPATGIVVDAAVLANADVEVLLSGIIHLHSLAPGWTVGGLIYVSKISGEMTQNVSGFVGGDQVQVLGIAKEDDVILFNPSYVLVEIA